MKAKGFGLVAKKGEGTKLKYTTGKAAVDNPIVSSCDGCGARLHVGLNLPVILCAGHFAVKCPICTFVQRLFDTG